MPNGKGDIKNTEKVIQNNPMIKAPRLCTYCSSLTTDFLPFTPSGHLSLVQVSNQKSCSTKNLTEYPPCVSKVTETYPTAFNNFVDLLDFLTKDQL